MINYKNLRDYLFIKGIKIEDVADAIELSRGHVSRVLNGSGKYKLSLEDIVKISHKFEIFLPTLLSILTNSEVEDPFFINQLNVSEKNENVTANAGKNDQQIIELQSKIIELQGRITDLIEENSRLKLELFEAKWKNGDSMKS